MSNIELDLDMNLADLTRDDFTAFFDDFLDGKNIKEQSVVAGTVIGIDLRQRVRSVGWYVLLGIFAVLSLVIAAIGLYGVLAYALTLRRREMGLRLALGARPLGILILAFRHGLSLALTGVALGLAAGWLATGALSSELYETSARNPTAFVGIPLLLLLVALAAILEPALRASRVHPAVVLKSDG